MKRIFPFAIFILLVQGFCVFAQETPPAELGDGETVVEAVAAEEEVNPDAGYIEMDIKTSTLLELAAWCRELGLSDGGSREDLASRLRNHFKLPSPKAAPQGQRTITIESAKTTEYFTLDVVDEEYARLKGDVIISLRDGNAIHRIKAWEILYNRTRNVMTATGSVVYTKEDGDTLETFKGETITVNLDNWSSIFMDGVSEKATDGNAAAYRFAGTVISRNDEEVTVLTRAEITNPANEEAYWSLNASKLWLLPGNDWAILNAVLKVGNIPVLYLPFFFYPADEIVFHPVLGYRSREGTFLQTTTYVLGRPKSSGFTENSITRIFGGDSENSSKVREGMFLRTTGEKRYDPSNVRLSVLFDAYVNMGAYLGTELALPAKGALGEVDISAGLGLTRNVYPSGTDYTPFPRYDGESEWNSGMLFSLGIPFRYRFDVKGSFKITYGSLSWQIPYYSDPYVDRDFMRRTEALDWLSMIREGVSSSDVTEDTYLNSYEWKISGALNPPKTGLDPYLSTFSISSMSSSLLFNQRYSRSYSGPSSPPNPGRAFFFPSRFTMFSVSAALAGTPFKTGDSKEEKEETKTDSPPGDALLPDLPISPWETIEDEEDAVRALSDIYTFTPPALGQKFTFASPGGVQFSVDYRLTPTTASELQFRTSEANWRDPEDINWGEVATIISRVRSDGNLDFKINPSGGSFYSGTLGFAGTGSWQDYVYINGGAEEFSSYDAVKSARDRAYNETFLTSSWDFTNTFRPFYQSSVWGATNLQHTIKGLLAKTEVDTTGSNPVWDWVFATWEKTDIETHQVSANLAAKVMDYNQNLSVSAVLPPKDQLVSGSAAFRAWITETSVRGRVLFPLDEEERKIEPVYFTETFRFNPKSSFQQYVVYDPELSEYTTFTSSFSFYGFTASYSALYAQPYEYNHNGSVDNSQPNGWIQMSEKGLFPNELRFGYSNTFAQSNLWDKRLSFSLNLNTNLSFDLQRYTNTKLGFVLGLKMGINGFLDLSLSTNAENVVMFKYFQGLPFFNLPVQLYPGEEINFFVDLLNSFRFDNIDLRRKSGFKMKALDLSLIHHLGDWNATLSMNMTPYLPAGSTSYTFSNEISFLIQWVPIGEIKTQIDYVKEILTVK